MYPEVAAAIYSARCTLSNQGRRPLDPSVRSRYAAAMNPRRYSPLDRALLQFDQGLRTLFGKPPVTGRPNPAAAQPEQPLAEQERKLSAALMRVNHVGEVCAQALYQGQALTARTAQVRESMQQAAEEENDHLDWCAGRLKQLGGRPSYLNPVWYGSALTLGAMAGALGDRWSLGFLAETEHQVAQHLTGHLRRLPADDARSRAIVEQMKTDELQHALTAIYSGAPALAQPIKGAMRVASAVMTRTAHYI